MRPELRRFHHCHGDMASRTLMKLSRPRDATPFKKCSAHVAGSSLSEDDGAARLLRRDSGTDEMVL